MANFGTFDLNLLRVLDALIETNSTTRAGEHVGLSQPAVSAALSRLRTALNDPLFIRHGPRLEPTEYATSLADPLRKLLQDLQALLTTQPNFDPLTSTDTFRLSGSDFFAEVLMPQLADHLSHHAPNMRVQLVDLVPDNHVGKLEHADVDLALIPHFDGPSWMAWQPLFHSRFVMIARKGHPRLSHLATPDALDLDTFCDLGHVLFSPEGNFEVMGDAALARIGRKRNAVMTLPVMYGVCSTVAETDYVALVAHQLADKLVRKLPLDVYPPPLDLPSPLLGMAWHHRHTNAPAHQWLRDQIATLLAEPDQRAH